MFVQILEKTLSGLESRAELILSLRAGLCASTALVLHSQRVWTVEAAVFVAKRKEMVYIGL